MLNWLGRYVFAATAVAPIALAYSWAAALQSRYLVALVLFAATPFLVLLCHRQIKHALANFERSTVTPRAAEATDRESIALIVLYLIPLFTYRFTDLQWNVIVPCMVLLGAVFSTGSAGSVLGLGLSAANAGSAVRATSITRRTTNGFLVMFTSEIG